MRERLMPVGMFELLSVDPCYRPGQVGITAIGLSGCPGPPYRTACVDC